jgi:GAF domain
VVQARTGLELEQIARDEGFCAHTILQSDVLTVVNPLVDDRFSNSRLVTEIGIRFYAGAPLLVGGVHPVGALAVMDRVPHLLTTEQMDFLQILARRIADELELRRTSETQCPDRRPHPAPPHHLFDTILVVEDNGDLREGLRRVLERHGFSVITWIRRENSP